MARGRNRRPLLLLISLVGSACGAAGAESPPGVVIGTFPPATSTTTTTTTVTTTTVAPPTSATPSTTSTTAPTGPSTSTGTTSTSTTSSTTTSGPAPTTTLPPPELALPATDAAFERLAANNAAASMTVVRDGAIAYSRATGRTIDGQVATGDSPMVVASVSKIVTALAVARLAEQGLVVVDAPVPWADLGLDPDPAWNDVTVRELLEHRSGMPVARASWFEQPGDCASHLPGLLARPPESGRGKWKYSNGNYCALGLLVAHLRGEPIDRAVQELVFDPIGVDGVHLTVDGQLPTDVAHRLDVARLSRLGGAGTFIVSTDDLAVMAAAVTADDLAFLRWPGVFTDQYGWGHTGTVDGARACLWLIEGGRTTIAATVAGDWPSSGGGVCDIVVPAVAGDLGIGAGKPDRTPP